jgi:ABC-type transport system substrate-binding protein
MFVVVSRPRYWLVGAAVSLIIFLIMYFTVIRPDNNAANNALRSGEQQVNQAIHNAKASGAKVPAGVTNLTSCLAAAGTNTSQIQACTAKFKP